MAKSIRKLVIAPASLVLALAGCGPLGSIGRGDEPKARPAVPPPKPVRAVFNPEVLNGADEVGVRSLLGPPRAVREQSPATVWAYGDEACGLDVFFFLDVSSDKFRVLSYEVKVAKDGESSREHCLGRLGAEGSE